MTEGKLNIDDTDFTWGMTFENVLEKFKSENPFSVGAHGKTLKFHALQLPI